MMRDLLRRLGFRRSEPDIQPEPPSPPVTARQLSPIELYEASGRLLADAPPATQEILRLAEESHQRRNFGPQPEDEIDDFDVPEPQGPLHAHQITPDDAALMRRMAGASFGPNGTVTLPSGRTVTGAEMQRWVETHQEPEPQDVLHAHEVTAEDAAAMRALAGSSFAPDSTIALPSGRRITGREIQRWLDSQQ